MWHWTYHNCGRPCYDDLLHFASARDQAFPVQHTSTNYSGPVTPVPSESLLSPSVSIDYSSLLTKDESIIETPRDPNWNLNFGRLTNETFVPIFSNNHSQCVQNFHSPTGLHISVLEPPHKLKGPKVINLTHINITIILSMTLC